MKLKSVFTLFIGCFFMINSAIADDYNAVLVADIETGRVLYQENATDLNYPASLTKIMTLYLTFDALEHDRLHLDDYLIVSQSATGASPVKLGLIAGSKIRVEDAIRALAVHSANDVARVLAENLKGGKEGSFASLMTQVANEIGLSQTNFENSSGLPDDDQLSSARDIALLSMAVYKHFPKYWKYFSIPSWTYNGKTYTNGNRLLRSYPGCDGMKTGFTTKSKYSLVATAVRGKHHLISVVLGAKNKEVRTTVSAKMLNRGFAMLGESGAPIEINNTFEDDNSDEEEITESKPVKIENNNKIATNNSGNSGIQFGAFSSRNAATIQQKNIKNKLNLNTNIEPSSNGMFRVRANGLSETYAQNLKTKASAGGIDCFVFRQ